MLGRRRVGLKLRDWDMMVVFCFAFEVFVIGFLSRVGRSGEALAMGNVTCVSLFGAGMTR